MDQLRFDQYVAAQTRDAAIEQVEAHADPEWFDAALRSVRATAETLDVFTTDDAIKYLAHIYPLAWTHEGRAWGPVMRHAALNGWVVNTGRVRPSDMPSNHRRPKTVWQSRIKGGRPS